MDSYPQELCPNITQGVVVWGAPLAAVERVEAAALGTPALRSKQAKKARECAAHATRWCRESRSMPSRRQFRIWCDYDKNINAMQWRAADAARAAVRH